MDNWDWQEPDLELEPSSSQRRLAFKCVSDADGVTPLTGLTFSAGDLKIGSRFSEANHAGTVTEIAAGFYFYEFTTAELNSIGALTLRITKSGVASRIYEIQVVGTAIAGEVETTQAGAETLYSDAKAETTNAGDDVLWVDPKAETTQAAAQSLWVDGKTEITQAAVIIFYQQSKYVAVTRLQKIYEWRVLPAVPDRPCALIPTLRILKASTLRPVMELDAYETLRYTRRWVDLDDFELAFSTESVQGATLAATLMPSDGSDQTGKYILNVSFDGVNDFTGLIEYLRLHEGGGQSKLVCRGFGLDRYLSARVILPPTGEAYDSYDGIAETVMKSMVDRHLINPITTGIHNSEDPFRAIAQMLIAVDKELGREVKFEGRFQRLHEGLREVSQGSSDLGFGITLAGSDLLFDVSAGEDKSRTVIFSPDLDNVAEFDYERDGQDFASHVYLAGQDQLENRVLIAQFTDESYRKNETRREYFQDARDLELQSSLLDRGTSIIQQRGRNNTIRLRKLPGSRPCYLEDFQVGDFVSFRKQQYGIDEVVRIYETEVSLAAGQIMEVGLTLNKPSKDWREAVKQSVLPASSRT